MMEIATTDNHDSDDFRDNEALTLARIYAFVINSHASKKAAPKSRPDDAKGSQHDRARYQYTS